MGCRIAFPQICLFFNDPSRQGAMLFSPHQDLAQQFACNPTRIAGEKSARERPERRHSESVSDVTMGIGRLTQGPMPNKRWLETTRLKPETRSRI
jgi:hypothetical protein